MAGRLNSQSFGYQFVQVVLPGSPSVETETLEPPNKSFLMEIGVPEDSFVVLWCGGYNAWTDVTTLFAGLEYAMSRNDKIQYVSVGANTYQAKDDVYTQLLDMIANSSYKDRFHMMGWRPYGEIINYYQNSDIGINIDSLHYETIYGTRTRIVEMLASSLPVITSQGCELSDLVNNYGAGLLFSSGDWEMLGRHILTLVNDKQYHEQVRQKALDYATSELSFETTTWPVRSWVRNARHAPDKDANNPTRYIEVLEYKIRAAVRQVLWKVAGLER